MRYTFAIVGALLLLSFSMLNSAEAGVLWVGSEDIDFPTGSAVCSFSNAGFYRTGYARAAISSCSVNTWSYSTPFPGGAVTSLWLGAQMYLNDGISSYPFIGLANSSATGSLWIGTSANSYAQMALWSCSNNASCTQLATEGGTSFGYDRLSKIDMHVVSYGASATVNVYVNGGPTPLIAFTGNVLNGSATALDSVVINGNGSGTFLFSEIVASSTDTRNLSLVTQSPAGDGDLNQWTGSYSLINPITIDDSSLISSSTSGNVFETSLAQLPTGNFSIPMVKVNAWSSNTGSGIGSVAVGVKTNFVQETPSATSLSTSWAPIETYYNINPETSQAWLATDINSLQINLKSAP